MHTEDEAKKLWCPFTRVVERWPDGGVSNARNRVANVKKDGDLDETIYPYGCGCIASNCMAWQWSDRPQRETIRLYKDQTEVDGEPVVRAGAWRVIKGEKWVYEYTDVDQHGEFEYLHRAVPDDTPQHGYCGLAGRPR